MPGSLTLAHSGDRILTSIFQAPFRWTPKVLAIIWCALAVFLCWLGTLPDEYLVNVRGITTPQPYPFQQIGIEIFVTAIIFIVLGWSLIEKSWLRVCKLMAVVVLAGGIGIFAGLGAMHSAEHFINFTLSMLLVSALTLVLALVLSIVGLILS